ncbi:DUF1287 domain-containing protein [uncultured Campylobacter sp.]|mgnify:CR=1 FL=1|uniref:DUF1287 domain-containing protein n=1 Tax=uncultured Campylobacter sp. TaxID=218934 RepID=UPI0026270423|nr:DUF1287 domain-containing protein [uncultured Campylobacter sp.]
MKIWSKILLLALAANFAFAFSAEKLVQDARVQVGRTLFYDPSYERLAYPMGDVDMIRGVCTDVVVRALHGQDIDHRRVPNIATYLKRKGYEAKGEFKAGDIVTWRLDNGRPHIGIVSDKFAADKTPLVIHNIGLGAQEEDVLNVYEITGHFRIK